MFINIIKVISIQEQNYILSVGITLFINVQKYFFMRTLMSVDRKIRTEYFCKNDEKWYRQKYIGWGYERVRVIEVVNAMAKINS